ncbi:MAG TPA: ADP-ribosylglycohydrolase family protein [Candidatus Binatia bacterium]|jgi:ADP-ribosylglycohydrolase
MHSQASNLAHLAHVEGALFGAMIGDSLGSQVENVSAALVAHRYPSRHELEALVPGPYGSTTEMTVALAESLAEFAEFDGENFAGKLLSHFHEGRGYGQGTMLALTRLKAGSPWQEAGDAHAGRGCYGNAAAARSTAVGLLHGHDVPTLRWIAEEAAGVTHTHALGVEGAVLFALGISVALEKRDDGIEPRAFFETIAGEAQVREYRSQLEVAADLSGKSVAPSLVVARLGNNQTALGSVVTALFCFADHSLSFVDAAVAALSLGGNASAITAMTLALAGAHLGVDGIPPRWIDAVEAAEIGPTTLRRLAARLAV